MSIAENLDLLKLQRNAGPAITQARRWFDRNILNEAQCFILADETVHWPLMIHGANWVTSVAPVIGVQGASGVLYQLL